MTLPTVDIKERSEQKEINLLLMVTKLLSLRCKLYQVLSAKHLPFFSKNPSDIPWGAHGVEIVVESTGVFTTLPKCQVNYNRPN